MFVVIAGYTAVVIANHGMGLLAFLGGALFLSAYLLIASARAGGDVKELLPGAGRAVR
jgi:hypothetical protein